MTLGIFDSGIGGLTVFKAISRLFPKQDLLYLADSARTPYGTCSQETVCRYTAEVMQFFLQKGVKQVVFACHTVSATTHGMPFPLPVITMVQGSLSLIQKHTGTLAVLATPRTIASRIYPGIPVACPEWVPLIESGKIQEDDVRKTLASIHADYALLACTHYPIIAPLIQKVLPHTTLLDPSDEVAQLVGGTLGKGQHEFFVTSDPEGFAQKAAGLLGYAIFPQYVELKSKNEYTIIA
jgi:glutamate racemase